jgi:hypothetical protein
VRSSAIACIFRQFRDVALRALTRRYTRFHALLRRILRRAVRYGRTLGFHEPFFHKLVDVLAETMGDVFPEIRTQQSKIKETIRREEEAFNATLDKGIALFEREVTRILGSAGASPAPFGASPNGSEIARNDLRFHHAGSEPIGNWQSREDLRPDSVLLSTKRGSKTIRARENCVHQRSFAR